MKWKIALFFVLLGSVLLASLASGNNSPPSNNCDCADAISKTMQPLLRNITEEIQQLKNSMTAADAKQSCTSREDASELIIGNIAKQIAENTNTIDSLLEELPFKIASYSMEVLKDAISLAMEVVSPMLTEMRSEIQSIRKATLNEWDDFVTSSRYSNVRMITNVTDYFPQRILPKSMPLAWAQKDCSWACASNQSCHSYNFIENTDSYVCELIPDNLCLNQTKIVLLNWPGSTIWEKRSNNSFQACLDAKYSSKAEIPCSALRPGCDGTWPKCNNCDKHCRDFSWRHFGTGFFDTVLWPEGDKPFAVPIFGVCFNSETYLFKRRIDLETGLVASDYRMSPADMGRISRLKFYPYIEFRFFTADRSIYGFQYANWNIDANGTLSNMTLHWKSSSVEDIFNLKGQALKPTPFVTVSEDIYGCGSFWLLDPKNATYCPGGNVGMLGAVNRSEGKIVSTGMHIPKSLLEGDLVTMVYAYFSV